MLLTSLSAVASADFQGQGQGVDRFENRELIRDAVENNDYDTFAELTKERSMIFSLINKANFNRLVAVHKLRQNGDFEGAREILNGEGMMHPRDFKKGMMNEENDGPRMGQMGQKGGDFRFKK